jgi:hypothetical protein
VKQLKNPRSPRVFLGPVEVAGYYRNLAKGFRELGVQCTFFTFKPHPFGYGGEDPKNWILKLEDKLDSVRSRLPLPQFMKRILGGPSGLLRILWVLTVVFSQDVFIFGFGRSLTGRSNWDLRLIKFLRKVIVINMAHGSEARPAYLNGANQTPDGKSFSTLEKIVESAKSARDLVLTNERFADYIIGAPYSTSYFANKRMINWFALGVPVDVNLDAIQSEVINDQSSRGDKAAIRILHSPSHPALKGTPEIIRVVQNLKAKGFPIELILLTGKPHSEVLEEIRKCDFVVDQIYSDTPMAGFACEAACLRKASIVGGYGLEELKGHVPAGMWPPTYICHPNEIQSAIEKLIEDRCFRDSLATQAWHFLESHWRADLVASRYLLLANDQVPEDWWIDPMSVSYLAGGGQKIERTIEIVREIINIYGVASLQLTHRPDLEQAFSELASANSTNG